MKILLFALLATAVVTGCDHQARGKESTTKTVAASQPESIPTSERRTVSCKAAQLFVQRTRIHAIEVTLITQYENTFDEKAQKLLRYPISVETISGRAITQEGQVILLSNFDANDYINASDDESVCAKFSFLNAGQFGVIKQFLSTGNPYPDEHVWFIHTPTQKLVAASEVLDNQGFLEQADGECIESIERGWGSSPGQSDLWCASADSAKLRRVARLMTLEENGQDFYWFRCERRSGIGNTSGKTHSISLGNSVPVSDQEMSARMDHQCDAWAKNANAI
jgi:hypothetical protein